jgi:DNA-binding beta-propeller fold protein YncE
MNKLNFKKHGLLALASITLLLNACKKDKQTPSDPVPTGTAGAYVLCEGAFGATDKSTITYYDLASGAVDKDYFKKQNGINLGTNASDLKQYGRKLYCVVTGSKDTSKDAYVEVINLATGKSIKRIVFSDANSDYSPRHIAFHNNKAYVTGYDGYITKIDTATLNIESRILVGGALEGIAIANDKLYAANSAHPQFVHQNNSSVSVVNLQTFTKIKDIPVSFNPTKIAVAGNGNLYVITSGSFDPFIASKFEILNSTTDTRTTTLDYSLSSMAVTVGDGYAITTDYPAVLKRLHPSSGVLGLNLMLGNAVITSLYEVTINPLDGNLYVADATNYAGDGKVFCFDAGGVKKFEFATGTAPLNVAFKYTYK